MQNARPKPANPATKGVQVRKRTSINKQTFLYDEMVMASNGTKYYIRYLDRDSNNQPKTNGSTTTTTNTAATRPNQLPSNIGSTTITRHTVVIRPQQKWSRGQRVGVGPSSHNGQTSMTTSFVSGIPATPGVKRKATDGPLPPSPTLRCDICHKQFSQRSHLTVHMQQHKDAVVTCPCGRKFAGKQFMLRHQQQRLQSEGVSCDSEAGKPTTSEKEAESAREILRRGLSGLQAAAVTANSEKPFDIELTETEEKLLIKWIKERYNESEYLDNYVPKALFNNCSLFSDNQPVRPGDVMKKVKGMDVPVGIGMVHFYKWLRKFIDQNDEIKDMVHKVLVGPRSAQEKANQD